MNVPSTQDTPTRRVCFENDPHYALRDDVKLAQLVRARDSQSQGRRFVSAKTQKTENSNLHGFELHRPSNKGTKLLFQVIKAIINRLGTQIYANICLCYLDRGELYLAIFLFWLMMMIAFIITLGEII